jgi:predicted butyrate kinase (DUF1464 family)
VVRALTFGMCSRPLDSCCAHNARASALITGRASPLASAYARAVYFSLSLSLSLFLSLLVEFCRLSHTKEAGEKARIPNKRPTKEKKESAAGCACLGNGQASGRPRECEDRDFERSFVGPGAP